MKVGLQLLLFFLSFSCRGGQYIYAYTDNCRRAYENYLSLHIQEARSNIISEIKANPYNLMAVYLADYEDCIQLLLNCDKKDLAQRNAHFDEHLDLLDKGDSKSPWHRFCKAGVYLHWAIINIRFGEQLSAANSFRKSFALLKENQRLYPSFGYNDTFAGLEEAVVGSLPGNYKWIAAIFGMKGNIRKGTNKLSFFLKNHTADDFMYAETLLYYLYTRFYLLQEQKETWEILSAPGYITKNNLLNTYVKANLALDYRKGGEALAVLRNAFKEYNYNSYPILDYQTGAALLYQCDTACTYYFNQYLAKNKSDLYIKDCWQKMAFAWYIAGNMPKAQYCRQQIKQYGTLQIDADKQAEKFGAGTTWPNKPLLQARMLIEGGYYNDAYKVLTGITTQSLTEPADKAEYHFRLGRVYEEMGNDNKALLCFQNSMDAGRSRHEQFAARAALHTGRIYERAGKFAQAKKSYEECLDMPEHDFQNSIDQQAKAGINRVEGY